MKMNLRTQRARDDILLLLTLHYHGGDGMKVPPACETNPQGFEEFSIFINLAFHLSN
jgi:hypothetical protein